MKAVRDLDGFIKDNTVKMQHPDKSRAEFLMKEAENSYSFLQEMINKIGIHQNNANDFVNYSGLKP